MNCPPVLNALLFLSLVQELKKRQLACGGKKDDLIKRLVRAGTSPSDARGRVHISLLAPQRF